MEINSSPQQNISEVPDGNSMLAGADKEVRNAVAKKITNRDEPSTFATAAPEFARLAANGHCDRKLAKDAIEAILDATEGPVPNADLLYGLDIGIELKKLAPHLEAAYPVTRLEPRVNVNPDRVADSMGDRLRLYRLLPYLPPAEHILDALKEYDKIFDGPPTFPGIDAPDPKEALRTYAGRIAQQSVQAPESVSEDLAHTAVKQYPSSSIAAVGDEIVAVTETALYGPIRDALDDASLKRSAIGSESGDALARAYLEEPDLSLRARYGVLLYYTLQGGLEVDASHFLVGFCQDITDGNPAPALTALIAKEMRHAISDPPEMPTDINPLAATQSRNAVALVQGDLDAGETLADLSPTDQVARDIDALDLPDRAGDDTAELMAAWARTTSVGALHPFTEIEEQIVLDHVTLGIEGRNIADRGLEVLEQITKNGSQFRPVLVEEYANLLEQLPRARTPREVKSIGKIFDLLDVYPLPDELRLLYSSTNPEIESEAKSINRRLRRNRSENLPDLHPDYLGSSVEEVLESIEVKYRCDDGIWRSLALSPIDQRLLETITSALLNGESDRIVLPYQDENGLGIVMVAMALAQVISPRSLSLYSPGTSGRWGTKADIQDIYTRFAFDNTRGDAVNVTPLTDIVPLSSIDADGSVRDATDWMTIPDDPEPVVIVKNWDDLCAADPDATVYNYIPSMDTTEARRSGQLTDGEDSALDIKEAGLNSDDSPDIEDEVDALEDGSHLEVHGLFERVGGDDGVPSIGPPTPLGSPSIPEPGGQESDEPVPPDSDQRDRHATKLLEKPRSITIRTVNSELDVRGYLDRMHDALGELGDVKTDEQVDALRSILSVKSEFEALPVPVDRHDGWIYKQRNSGNFYVPRTIDNRIRSLSEASGALQVGGQAVDMVEQAAKSLRDALSKKNPLFQALVDILDDSLGTGKRTAIMASKKTHKDMLADHFEETTEGDALRQDGIILTDPDTVRQLHNIDRLVMFGVPSPRTIPLSLHPAVSEVVILAYEGDRAVGRYREFLERRRPILAGQDGPTIAAPEIQATADDVDIGAGEEAKIGDTLYRAYREAESLGSSEGGASGDRTYLARFDFTFIDGSQKKIPNYHPAIVRADQELVSTGDYVQRRVLDLRAGDTLVDIERETRQDMWEEYLRQRYEGSDAEETFVAFLTGIEYWYEAIQDAFDSADSERPWIDVADRLSEAGVPVDRTTILTWTRGVNEADSAKDLVFRSDLPIGPQEEDAVQYVAKELDSTALENNWKAVFSRMKVFRTVNRGKGKDFWNHVVRQANSGDLFDRPGIVEREITSIEELG